MDPIAGEDEVSSRAVYRRKRLIGKNYLAAARILIVVLIAFFVYSPTLNNGFTNWDDPELILNNAQIRNLSPDNITYFFSTSIGGFGGYTPLVFLSYSIEYRFFKLNPRAFHTSNLILHLLNTILVYGLMSLVTRKAWVSFAISLLFGVHPLHVEAVAWIQGRKDLLFSLFYLGAAISFALFSQRKGKRLFYILSLLFCAASLLSKITAISFPLVVLLLEYYLQRDLTKSSLKRAAPFFALSAFFLLMAFLTYSPGFGHLGGEKPGYLQNIALFFYSFLFYVGKMVLPFGLIARYSVHIGPTLWTPALNLVIFLIVGGLVMWTNRRSPKGVTFGVAFFVFTLLPTLPFHFIGQPYADRYMYLPMIGFCIAMYFIYEQIRQRGVIANWRPKLFVVPFLLSIVALWGFQTWRLSHVWRDSLSLWTNAIKQDPLNSTAYLERGVALADSGQLDKALLDYNRAAQLSPQNPDVFNNRGFVFFKKGRLEEALRDYDQALLLNPLYPIGYINRGILWGRRGDFSRAIQDFSTAINLDKTSHVAYAYRGMAFQELNEIDKALEDFRSAFRMHPTTEINDRIEVLLKKQSAIK